MVFEAGLWGGQQLKPTLWQQLRAGFFWVLFLRTGFLRNTGTSGEWIPWPSSVAWAEAGEEMVLPTSGGFRRSLVYMESQFYAGNLMSNSKLRTHQSSICCGMKPSTHRPVNLLSRPSFHQCHKGRINHVSGKSQDKSWPCCAKTLGAMLGLELELRFLWKLPWAVPEHQHLARLQEASDIAGHVGFLSALSSYS